MPTMIKKITWQDIKSEIAEVLKKHLASFAAQNLQKHTAAYIDFTNVKYILHFYVYSVKYHCIFTLLI